MDGSGAGTFSWTYSYEAVGNRTFGYGQGTIECQYNLAGEITSMVRIGGNQVTHVYDLNGNVVSTNGLQFNIGNALVTMGYDKENRQISHSMGSTVVTYTYSGDGLKRSEITGSGTTTMIWDGSEYLQERS
jgi:hypothetical protein